MRYFVAVEGIIGAGKTTLCDALAAELGGIAQHEPADGPGGNVFLDDYYRDPKRWGFTMQVNLLHLRKAMHREAQARVRSGESTFVTDRTIYGDRCFAELCRDNGSMDAREFEAYRGLHLDLLEGLLYPSCMVFLDVPVELAERRIVRRMQANSGRLCESSMPEGYLAALDARVRALVASMERFLPVIRVAPLDVCGNEIPAETLARQAAAAIPGAVADWCADGWAGVR